MKGAGMADPDADAVKIAQDLATTQVSDPQPAKHRSRKTTHTTTQ
jgi:hypothetical protein